MKIKYNSEKYTYPNVHASVVYTSQDMEATSVTTNRWMDKEYVVCVHTHTLEYYSVIKKNKNFVICSNMDGLGEHYAK